jgi:hypothetical protein
MFIGGRRGNLCSFYGADEQLLGMLLSTVSFIKAMVSSRVVLENAEAHLGLGRRVSFAGW